MNLHESAICRYCERLIWRQVFVGPTGAISSVWRHDRQDVFCVADPMTFTTWQRRRARLRSLVSSNPWHHFVAGRMTAELYLAYVAKPHQPADGVIWCETDPLVCWDCGTPLAILNDGAMKPCGHTGTVVVSRSVWEDRHDHR